MDAKVRDYPDLIRRDRGVVNTNADDYLRAKSRIRQQKRIDNLENDLNEVSKKLDIVLAMLVNRT